jgi:hypothetical protein
LVLIESPILRINEDSSNFENLIVSSKKKSLYRKSRLTAFWYREALSFLPYLHGCNKRWKLIE